MSPAEQTPDLERLAAHELASELNGVATGAALSLDMTSKLSLILERFIPQLLRQAHPEWEKESIDGFFFSRTRKTDETSAELVGTCILISDQTVTPFTLDLTVAHDGSLRPVRVRLGERGGGPLGISGPVCTSSAANKLLLGLVARLDRIKWVYIATIS